MCGLVFPTIKEIHENKWKAKWKLRVQEVSRDFNVAECLGDFGSRFLFVQGISSRLQNGIDNYSRRYSK